jgi:uncharacterized membrane protein
MTDGDGDTGGPADHAPGEAAGHRASLWTRAGRTGVIARSGHLEYDRILFFSDAIFAIAITLLIVDLPGQLERVRPDGKLTTIESGQALHNAALSIIGFGISFAVIGLFWMGHHSLFRFIKAFDRRLMLLNLLFLGSIAFLPYPTALLSASSASQTPAVVFYAVCAGAAGLMETLVWIYACRGRPGLVTSLSPQAQRLFGARVARIPVVFALSIPIALVAPTAATVSWAVIPVIGGIVERYLGRHDPADTVDPLGLPDPQD